MKVGRKPHYDSVDALQNVIDAYFAVKEMDKKFPSITGLAYALGFESKQSFYDYEKNPEFSYSIKRARLLIEESYESGIRTDKAAAGCIFALKNFGWIDKQEIELDEKLTIEWHETKTYLKNDTDS